MAASRLTPAERAALERDLHRRQNLQAPGYRASHWGHGGVTPRGAGVVADPRRDRLVELGELVTVVYDTTKLGHGASRYRHTFEAERPVLAYSNPGGLLVVVGGDYRVSWRGIVG